MTRSCVYAIYVSCVCVLSSELCDLLLVSDTILAYFSYSCCVGVKHHANHSCVWMLWGKVHVLEKIMTYLLLKAEIQLCRFVFSTYPKCRFVFSTYISCRFVFSPTQSVAEYFQTTPNVVSYFQPPRSVVLDFQHTQRSGCGWLQWRRPRTHQQRTRLRRKPPPKCHRRCCNRYCFQTKWITIVSNAGI